MESNIDYSAAQPLPETHCYRKLLHQSYVKICQIELVILTETISSVFTQPSRDMACIHVKSNRIEYCGIFLKI